MSKSNGNFCKNDASLDEDKERRFYNGENGVIHFPDAQLSDHFSGTLQETTVAENSPLAQQTETSLPSSSTLEVASDEQNYTIATNSASVRLSSAAVDRIPSRQMSSALNQRLVFHSEFQSPSSDSIFTSTATLPPQRGAETFQKESEGTYGNNASQKQQVNTISSQVPPAHALSSKRLQYCDSVKPPAPSSVKSYGSNLGSDDCGGSLDVETHSDDARSIDDAFPVSMPEQDPETAAVASLSIDPIERSNSGNRFPVRYNSDSQFIPLTLQRFHQNYVDQVVREANSQQNHDDPESCQLAQSIYHTDDAISTNTCLNWDDPRMDKHSSNETRRKIDASLKNIEDQSKTRSRSRSRTPPTEH